MKFLVYDVETAQKSDRGSICSVGWVLLDNDRIIDQGYSLINPNCSFSNVNTSVHGLTAKDVKDAPCFGDYWNDVLCQLMTSSVVLAHNASFDMYATEQALYSAGIEDPGIDYIDTLHLFKIVVNAESYKLSELTASIGYEYQAHNSLEDALALTHLLFRVRDLGGFDDLATMVIRASVPCENTQTNNYEPHDIKPSRSFKSHCRDVEMAASGVFSGLRFCITGDLPGYERADLERMILENGGKPMSAVSGKTDYLLVCEQVDIPYDKMTGKHRQATDLISAGGKIKIINPDQFFAMIQK